jgi:glycine/D-amino acid oxidase-like deaminating enzyme
VPDAIVIGGGVIGACAAWQLAERGADVLLLERGALASGATARSQGLLLPPDHAPMVPLFERSNELYDLLADRAGVDIGLDREPIGTLMLATDPAQLALLGRDPRMDGTLLDAAGVRAEEPALAPGVSGGLVSPYGRRSDPGALTAVAAIAASSAGARVRRHVEVRRITERAVISDEGIHRAELIVLAAGAWSRPLARAAGHDLPIRPVRGWLAVTAPCPPLLRHVIYEADYSAVDGPRPGRAVSTAELAQGDLARDGAGASHALGVHQNLDGSVMIGASRSAALHEGTEGAEALRENAARACRLIPALSGVEVAATWTGLRPFSADGLPYIGRLEPWLVVCAGHGSEGILTGAGSAQLAAQIALGERPFTDPSPFSPQRIAEPSVAGHGPAGVD